jgi:uncharacterized protein YukJ
MRRSRFRPHGSPAVYGVLVGTVTDGAENPDTTHYEILVDAAGEPYRIAVNITSQDGSEDIVFFDRNFKGDTKVGLGALVDGPARFQELTTGPEGTGLDYLRDPDLVHVDRMRPIPADGNSVSLAALLAAQIERAKADNGSTIIAFGNKFDDHTTTENLLFKLGRGVHDIHMMQGNLPDPDPKFDHSRDNRVNGDGALFIRFSNGETVALFSRFRTQSTKTDDNGNAV